LDRTEAVNVLKQILESCRAVDGQNLLLLPPSAANLQTNGYQIHLKMKLVGIERKCIQKILEEHQLIIKEIEDTTIIYKPEDLKKSFH
jgi:hypothetical protein